MPNRPASATVETIVRLDPDTKTTVLRRETFAVWPNTPLTKALGIRYPVIQAGMAGGATTPELIAAVSNAGGLGTLGAGYMSPEQMPAAIRAVKALTRQPFAVNLFIPQEVTVNQTEVDAMKRHLQPYRDKLGLSHDIEENLSFPPFSEQVQVLMEERVPVFSCTFGVPDRDTVQQFKKTGITVMGTATTLREAKMLEERGMDMIVVQSQEAGGHRGTFLHRAEDALIGGMALIPQAADSLNVPVIAAGGIMDGRGIIASLALGAVGVQMGSAFLACTESGITSAYKKRLVHSTDESTTLTTAFSGKAARGIRNQFIIDHESTHAPFPPYPVQNALTKELRAAAKQQNQTEMMSLWSGQAAGMASIRPAAELIAQLDQEVRSGLQSLQG